MNQEVKIINGYKVKDEKAIRTYDTVALMVSDSKLTKGQHVKTKGYNSPGDGAYKEYYITDELDESVINLSNGLYAKEIKDICEFIYPGKWGYHTSGNSKVIRVGGKVLLFDTNDSWAYDYLKEMFEEYKITHIDYIILSHFDTDHRANLTDLINDGFIDENSVYYHPECVSEIYSQETIDWYNQVESLCESVGVTSIIPEEKQIVNITNNFSLKFGNVDTEYTIANYTNSNSASMIVETKHNNFRTLVMGDAQPDTLQRLFDIDFIEGEICLYDIPHHAINTSTYTPFYDLINPEMAVAQVQMEDFTRNKLVQNQASALLNDKGCINYYSCMNENNLYFVEEYNNIQCVKGIPHSTVGKYSNATNIYVDSSIELDSIQDGTQEHPYRDLSQAVGCVSDYPNRNINIILAPGTYGTGNPAGSTAFKNRINLFNWKNILTITTTGDNTDTFIADGISVSNCYKIKFTGISFYATSTRDYCAYLNNSSIYFENCKFTSDTTDKRNYGIFCNEWSDVTIRSCEFNYLANAVDCRNNSTVNLINNTFNNLTRIFYADSSSIINNHSMNTSASDYTTIDNINNYNSSDYLLANNVQGVNITNSKMTGAINLPFKINNIYKFIEFSYEMRWNNSQSGRNRVITKLADLTSFVLSDFNVGNDGKLKVFTCVMDISYTNGTITISRNTAGELDTGTMTTHNPANSDTADYGIKITNIRLY